jgi:hypothetical protein
MRSQERHGASAQGAEATETKEEERSQVGKKRLEVVTCRLVGNKLKTRMKELELSQEETAKRALILTSRQLTRLVNKEHCPSLTRAVALATVLGVDVFELFDMEVKTRRV